ncbi:DUF2017 family protein [Agromyces seonyuensis]|uniref:DUF2017 family protein n=1 Tax=Agromyces seonyuensis TaxID=2662446 RepID=A0A6I4NXQ9_9MICO|nr:DUF2017 family protein [Agromyces seonyuensis]MWB97922.1 DUF2017 family protein [Agromyces seonyuensis]
MIVASRPGAEGVRLVLESEEAMLLAELADQVDSVLLLGTPDDPAVGRLLPNAYPDDAEAEAEYSRYTRGGLRDGKRQAAQIVRDATRNEQGHPTIEVVLDEVEAWSWLTFLTDLRLILSERVGLGENGEPEDDDERDDYLRAAYEWAGFVQGSMLEVLDPMEA